MIDTDDLIRAAVHELVASAPEPRVLGELQRERPPVPERLVPVMSHRANPRRPSTAALVAVAAAISVVGGIWYLTSDPPSTEPALDRPTDDPGSVTPSTTAAIRPTTTAFTPRAVQRAAIIAPIPDGEVALTDTEVLILDGDRVVAVDTATDAARVVASASDPHRVVGAANGTVVVERCCDGELVATSGATSAANTPIMTPELDLDTGRRIETPTTGWRLAAIQPSGGRLAAVVESNLVIASTTGTSGTVRSLLELGSDDEPVFGTVTDPGWTGTSVDLVLVEERGGDLIVHRVGGSTGAHIDRAVVAPVGSVDGVSFAGSGPGRSFAVHVDAQGAAPDEVRLFDGTTLDVLDRIDLPPDAEQVRIGSDGSVVWIDTTGITIRHPDGSLTTAALP